MSEITITVTDAPDPDAVAELAERLTAFNDQDAGPSNRVPLAVFVRNESGEIVAGISGNTGWGWLYVQLLFVAESQRGQGLAGRMLDAAEEEARRRGCTGAYIDTFSPVALRTYQRAGYVTFGEMPNFFMGRTRTFLQKQL